MANEDVGGSVRKFLDMHQAPDIATAESMVPEAKKEWGPLENLLGHWRGRDTGWNMIALPFNNAPPPPNGFNYRVLMNQYHEDLDFTFVDENVPNRGLLQPGATEFDQKTQTMDYQQVVAQTSAEDKPHSGLAGGHCMAIHHEPGLFLHMKNLTPHDINIARLASIPHGNSIMALGKGERVKGMPDIPPISGMPIGRFEDISTHDYDFRAPKGKEDDYLYPYRHYIENPFRGNVPAAVVNFPGFSPANMNAILSFANEHVDIAHTTVLTFDTQLHDGGISNIPFVVREAEPVSMRSTFYIQELKEKDNKGNPKLRMQYTQVVMLNFFEPREDQLPGRATWPHISINTLHKIDENDPDFEKGKLSEVCKA